MFNGCLLRVRNDFKYSENALQVLLTARAVDAGGALDATPKLGDRYCGELNLFIRMRAKPGVEIECFSLRLDDDIRID